MAWACKHQTATQILGAMAAGNVGYIVARLAGAERESKWPMTIAGFGLVAGALAAWAYTSRCKGRK